MSIKKLYYFFNIIKSKNSIAYSILVYELLGLILLPLNIFFSLIEKFFLKKKRIIMSQSFLLLDYIEVELHMLHKLY